MNMNMEQRRNDNYRIKTEVLGEKDVPVQLRRPLISQGFEVDRTWAFTVSNRLLNRMYLTGIYRGGG